MSQSAVEEQTTVDPAVLQRTAELLGKRWTSVILLALMRGYTQFRQISETIPDLSDRMLSERLKEFRAEGLVKRTVIPDIPVRITYDLTPKGKSLRPIFENLSRWGEENLAQTTTHNP